jgi:hypothetical protein
MDNFIFKNPEKFTKNPLGLIGLLLVVVYGISMLATSMQTFNDTQKSILLAFMVGYPVFVLIALYLLVTKHHEKLYFPLDFKNANSFEHHIVEMKFNRLYGKVEEKIDRTITEELEKKLADLDLKFRYESL